MSGQLCRARPQLEPATALMTAFVPTSSRARLRFANALPTEALRVSIRACVILSTIGTLAALPACGGSAAESSVSGTATGPNAPGSAGAANLNVGVANGAGAASNSATGGASDGASQVITSLPAGFTMTDVGGYKLGAALSAGGAGAMQGAGGGTAGTKGGNCGNVLLGVVRDFRGANDPGGHPDFEAAM
jgi:hypothetical protein